MPAIERLSANLDLDAFVEPFESAAARGERPRLAAFLPQPTHPKYIQVLGELIRLDLEFAWDRGERPRLDSYLREFPALADDPVALSEIAQEEWRQRIAAGEQPDAREYGQKFGLELPADPQPTFATDVAPLWLGNHFPSNGEVLPPGFIVRSELGRGAFGRVYLAEQVDLAGRQVAIKVSSRLIGEAQTLARLQHTNIVPIYSVHRVGDYQILVMPYLGSATLADLLKTIRSTAALPATAKAILTAILSRLSNAPSGPGSSEASAAPDVPAPESLPLATMDYTKAVLSLGAAIADALAHAHVRGILHRDLKPANVLLANDGRPMLLDFNLAADEAGGDDIVGGTPRYMAPEHLASLSGESVRLDGRVDVYSLGLVLHELLTGRIPFPDRSGAWNELVRANRQDRAQSPRANVASPGISAILNKALEADPNRRYRTANELHEDLIRQIEDRPLKFATEPWSRERWRKWVRRHPRLTSATTVSAIALIILFACGMLLYSLRRDINERQAREERDRVFQARDEIQSLTLDSRGPPSRFNAARTLAKDVLIPYDGLKDGWRDAPAFRDLPEPDQNALRDALVHLLYYQAEAGAMLAMRESDDAKRTRGIDESLQINERARGVDGGEIPLQPLLDQRSRLLEAMGSAPAKKIGRQPDGGGFVQAQSILRNREYAEAAKRFESLGENGRRSFPVWMGLGTARLRMGQFDQAADAFMAASAIKPENPWPDFYRGIALLSAGRLADAREMFDRLIVSLPDEPEGWLNRAIVRFRTGDFAGARGDLFEAEKREASPTRIHAFRAQIAKSEGNVKLAADEHTLMLKASPRDADDWTIRGESRLRQPSVDAKAALVDFDAALAIEPAHAEALRGKASCLSEHLNRPAEAIAALERLLTTQPDNIDDRGGYAVLLARAGKADDAKVQARKCVQPAASALVLYQAASALALTAKTADERSAAMELVRRVLRQDPSWANHMPADTDLKAIQSEQGFEELIKAARTLQERKQ